MSGARIEDWLPEYQVRACYSTLVHSSVERTFAALAETNLSDLPIVRRLMRLRGYRANAMPPALSTAQASRHFGSFLELAILPQEEVVLGIAGRFWRPDGGIVRDLTPQEFHDFCRQGYAKAAWNFRLTPAEGGTRLSTETRVQTFGRWATVKFRLYWLVVELFSGLIRKAMLREVKRIAEQSLV